MLVVYPPEEAQFPGVGPSFEHRPVAPVARRIENDNLDGTARIPSAPPDRLKTQFESLMAVAIRDQDRNVVTHA
jgi:hypothetical protein